MSAQHKRPFFMFAAVAAVCCMVLVTGVRSKANDSPGPEFTAPPVASAGPAIERMSGASGRSVPLAIRQAVRVLRIDSSYGSPAVTTSRGERNARLSTPPHERGGAIGRERGVDATPTGVAPVHDMPPPVVGGDPRAGMSGKGKTQPAQHTAKWVRHAKPVRHAKFVKHAKSAQHAAKSAHQRGKHERGAGKGHRRHR